MKKIHLSIIFLLTTFLLIQAQESKVAGTWLLTKVETEGEVETPYIVLTFKKDLSAQVSGVDVGTWSYDKKSHAIEVKSQFEEFKGSQKILSLSKSEMRTALPEAKLYYRKINPKAIAGENSKSGLFGMWEFNDVPYEDANTYITFTEPDEYEIFEKGDGRSSTTNGTWIYDSKAKSLILLGSRGFNVFKGENIVEVNDETITLVNNETLFKGRKKVTLSQPIERLTFSEADFYTDDGDYKYYDDEENLPWRDIYAMKLALIDVHQLVYNYSTFIEETGTFETKTLTANVTASPEEDGYYIDYIFYGFDQNNVPEDTGFPSNKDYSAPLYPLHESIFRIVGTEELTTPAGTFECTVIEAVGDSDLRKMWMINTKIGVYAKIIIEDPDETFGYYYIYELQQIK